MSVSTGIHDILAIFPLLAVFFASTVPLLIKSIKQKEPSAMSTLIQALSGVGIAAGWILISYSAGSLSVFSNALIIDGTSYPSVLLILLATGVALLISYENVNVKGEHFAERVFLILNSCIGMMTMVWANDLLVTFIGLEIMSIALYLLVAMSHEQTLAKEAAFKYFIMGGFSAAVFLYGLAFIFGSSGVTELSSLKSMSPQLLANSRLFVLGWSMMLVGFCFKVSIFPFHFWTPDVYQGAPTPITAFMATAVKTASFIALLKFILSFPVSEAPAILDTLQWMAILTILVGNIGAIMQENLKRMLAYSSIAHSGYAFIALIVAGSGSGEYGSTSLIFYLLTYSVMNLGAFAIVALFEKFEEQSLHVSDLKGLANKYPYLSFCLAIFLLSLAGIPPTAGFFGKLYVFSGAINSGFIWLAVWGVLGSVISVYYYLRPIVMMYMFDDLFKEQAQPLGPARVAVGVSLVLVLMVGLLSSPIFMAIQKSVKLMFQ